MHVYFILLLPSGYYYTFTLFPPPDPIHIDYNPGVTIMSDAQLKTASEDEMSDAVVKRKERFCLCSREKLTSQIPERPF